MRIGWRKKIGSFYIGSSISTKKLGNGVAAIFMLPFYFVYFCFLFMYYVCVYPFVLLYRLISKRSVNSNISGNKEREKETVQEKSQGVETKKTPIVRSPWYIIIAVFFFAGGLSAIPQNTGVAMLGCSIGIVMGLFTFWNIKDEKESEGIDEIGPTTRQVQSDLIEPFCGDEAIDPLPIEDCLREVDLMEGHQFEHWCADLIRKNGFINVEVTRGSGDQGVDVLAEKDGIHYAIQCKCYTGNLGNTPIQEVHAGKAMYNCQIGVVMTNRYFTAGAKELAEKTGVLLWDRDKISALLDKTKT